MTVPAVIRDLDNVEEYMGCRMDRLSMEFCLTHHVRFVEASPGWWRCPVALAAYNIVEDALKKAQSEVVARVLREHGIEEEE